MSHLWQYGLYSHKYESYCRRCEKCKQIDLENGTSYTTITAGILDSDCRTPCYIIMYRRWQRRWRRYFYRKNKKVL